jgi:hypothetical protein
MKTNKNRVRGLANVSHLFLSGPTEPSREKVTIQTAAKLLNVSKGTVVTYLNKGLLTRIRERGCIYIAKDEVSELRDSGRLHRDTHGVSESGANDAEQKGSYSQLCTKRGQFVKAGHDVSETVPATTHRNMDVIAAEVVNLKQKLAAQACQLEDIRLGLERLRKRQQKELADFSKATETEVLEVEKTKVRMLAVEEELQKVQRSWWKRALHLKGKQ